MRSLSFFVLLGCLIWNPATGALAQDDIDLPAIEQQIQSVLEKVRACTVGVGGGGSGVVVSKEGHVLTCAHVAREAGRRVIISFPDGRTARATTLGNYYSADAGVLKIDKPGDYPWAEMADAEDIKVADWVLAVGYPITFPKRQLPPVRIGRITRYSRNQLVTDAPIMGGDSGGPLFNLDGQVVGVNSRVSGPITMNVHVPIDQYHRNWERLLASEDWPESRRPNASRNSRRTPQPEPKKPESEKSPPKKPESEQSDPFRKMGVRLEDSKVGPKVTSLVVDSPAHRSGLRAGHVVRKIGGVSVRDAEACRRELRRHLGKESIEFVVTRQDKSHGEVTLPVRLQDKK